jgi:hypothetical protein
VKLFLIPPWLRKSLNSNNISVSKINDLNYLSTTISANDLAFYIFLNQKCLNLIINPNILNSFETNLDYTNIDDEKTINKIKDAIDTYHIEYKHIDFNQWFKLFFEEVYSNQSVQFLVFDYDKDYVIVYPYIAAHEIDNQHYIDKNKSIDLEKPLHHQLLTVLNQFYSVDYIAKLSIFRYSITH